MLEKAVVLKRMFYCVQSKILKRKFVVWGTLTPRFWSRRQCCDRSLYQKLVLKVVSKQFIFLNVL